MAKDETVRIWTVAGQKLAEIEGYRGIPRRVVFSREDNYFAVIEDKNLGISIFSMTQPSKTIGKIEGNNNQFSCLSFSPDEQRIATVGLERIIRLWDLRGRLLAQLNLNDPQILLVFGHLLNIMGDGFSPYIDFTKDGQWVVFIWRTIGSPPAILWKVENPESLLERGEQWLTEDSQDDIDLKIQLLLDPPTQI